MATVIHRPLVLLKGGNAVRLFTLWFLGLVRCLVFLLKFSGANFCVGVSVFVVSVFWCCFAYVFASLLVFYSEAVLKNSLFVSCFAAFFTRTRRGGPVIVRGVPRGGAKRVPFGKNVCFSHCLKGFSTPTPG